MNASRKYQSTIVFNSAIDVNSAIEQSFILGFNDSYECVGMVVNHEIKKTYNDSP